MGEIIKAEVVEGQTLAAGFTGAHRALVDRSIDISERRGATGARCISDWRRRSAASPKTSRRPRARATTEGRCTAYAGSFPSMSANSTWRT